MTNPAIENYEALDAGAHVDDQGATGTITLLTKSGRVVISMKRAVMEQLNARIEGELRQNPIPIAEKDREIS
jgi:hypothetical protein